MVFREYLEEASFDELLALAAKYEPALLAESFPEAPLKANCLRLLGEFAQSAERNDPVLVNFYRNHWEFAWQKTVLQSYPWDVSLPIAHSCNAKCLFCDSWMHRAGLLKPENVRLLLPVLRYARYLGLQGHGEPLVNPRLGEILSLARPSLHPKCILYIITNGRLLPRYRAGLLEAGVVGFHISLNAAGAATHHRVMHLGEDAFDIILAEIRHLVAWRDSRDPRVMVNISMVVTADNLEDGPEFVRLGNRLGVNRIYFKTLNPTGAVPGTGPLPYARLPPYLHPEFRRLADAVRQEVATSRTPVDATIDDWDNAVYQPEYEARLRAGERFPELSRPDALAHYGADQEPVIRAGFGRKIGTTPTNGPNPFRRASPFPCYFPYQTLNLFGADFSMPPCCFIGPTVPGYEAVAWDGDGDFLTFWNAPAFVELRRSLAKGPLMDSCKVCPTAGQR